MPIWLCAVIGKMWNETQRERRINFSTVSPVVCVCVVESIADLLSCVFLSDWGFRIWFNIICLFFQIRSAAAAAADLKESQVIRSILSFSNVNIRWNAFKFRGFWESSAVFGFFTRELFLRRRNCFAILPVKHWRVQKEEVCAVTGILTFHRIGFARLGRRRYGVGGIVM